MRIPPPARQILSILAVAAALSSCRNPEPKTRAAEEISGERAFEHVRRLVEFGPRPSGSAALKQSADYIAQQLTELGWDVQRQRFTSDTPRGPIEFVNLIARLRGANRQPTWLLASHYDTKLFDTMRFVGANDGGSSTGLLLEIARVLRAAPELGSRVELVFFDGEEAFESYTDKDGLYGSRHFAEQLRAQNLVKQFRGGILFDMIGDKSLTVTISPDSPPQLARGIFASAEALNVRNHFTYHGGDIMDDHTPLNAIGIPVIDLIDFDFPAWHTADDSIDNIRPESLRIVGAVALHFIATEAMR